VSAIREPGEEAEAACLTEKEDGRMAEAASVTEHSITGPMGRATRPDARHFLRHATRITRAVLTAVGYIFLVSAAASGKLYAEADCLTCHADQSMQDAAGHSISVDGAKFGKSIHGSLKCGDCHTDIKDYPHPEPLKKVQCSTCHADQASGLAGSVHADKADHPCTSCHGDAHSIFPKTDPRSAVYPLNIPRTCGNCHGTEGMAKKHGLPSVYPLYMDSIH